MRPEEFNISMEDFAIRGYVMTSPAGVAETKRVVVLCHGIPGGRPDCSHSGYAHLAESIAHDGHDVVFFNFRGAGASGGNFDIRGWVDDLQAVLTWVRKRFSSSPVLFGFSAGGAVAVCVAGNSPGIGGLLLCGTPARFTTVLGEEETERFLEHARTIGIIRQAGFPADRDRWMNGFRAVCAEQEMGGCGTIPKLIIHGNDDDTVPVEHAYRLYDAALEPRKLVIVAGGGHRLRLNEEAMNIARTWLKQVSSEAGAVNGKE